MPALAVALLGVTFSGCAVGPDFHRPEPPKVSAYTAAPLPAETTASLGGGSQRLLPGRDVPAEWWKLFRSEPLNKVITIALANSPTVAAAQAALRQAQENRRAQVAAFFPSIDANFSARRSKISGAAFGETARSFPPFTLYDASVSVSYTLDIFGGIRREVEALQARVDYQRFEAEATYLTLTANIVTTAVREASLRGQIRFLQEIIVLMKRQLALVEVRFASGAVSEIDVAAQRTQLADTMAMLPPLEKELSQSRHLLAVLAGKFPSEEGTLPLFELETLHLPDELPVTLPSSLARQRPDILAAEELLHAASAEVGVATANLYPQITLSGSLGSDAVKIGSLFSGGSAIWSLGGGLVQPLFHGGELTAKRRAAIAAFEQAGAQYRETVLEAFQDVADVLRALDRDALTLKAYADAVQSAGRTLELTQDQLLSGAVSYLSLLDADRQYQQARLNLVQAQAARFADTAALFHALGGGWWNREGGGR